MFKRETWDPEDRLSLRRFLDSPAGHRLLAELWFMRPGAGSDETVDSAALCGKKLEGYLQALANLHYLAYGDEELERQTKLHQIPEL